MDDDAPEIVDWSPGRGRGGQRPQRAQKPQGGGSGSSGSGCFIAVAVVVMLIGGWIFLTGWGYLERAQYAPQEQSAMMVMILGAIVGGIGFLGIGLGMMRR